MNYHYFQDEWNSEIEVSLKSVFWFKGKTALSITDTLQKLV